MAAPVSTVLRETVLARAVHLREQAAAGRTPYPDAILEANEQFVAQLEQSPANANVADLLREASQKADSAEGRQTFLGLVGGGGALAAAIFAIACPPVGAYVVAAASSALAARLVLSLAARAGARGASLRKYTRQLEAWSRTPKTELKVPAWSGPVTVGGLRTLTREFPREVKEFPYEDVLLAEHERLMRALPDTPDRPVAELTQEKVKAARNPARHVSVLPAATLRAISNGCWIGGCAALASGQTWLGVGLLGGTAASWMLRRVLDSRVPEAPARTARSLHYWEANIQAAPQTTPETIIFNGDRPRQPDPTIQRSEEDVRIGGIKVPVRRGEAEDEAP